MKFLVILLLIVGIFGGAYYATYRLYLKPRQALAVEIAGGPATPPPDPTIPEFEKLLASQDALSLPDARTMWAGFLEHYPESTRLDQAKDILGRINVAIFLSNMPSPEKQVYLVKAGDVISKVAARQKTTEELLMRINNMQGDMLRIGQKLVTAPSDFSVTISRSKRRVILLYGGKFFKQYPILAMPVPKGAAAAGGKAAATPRPPKIQAKVVDRIAWYNGQRVVYKDKTYPFAEKWITIPGGHSLYCEHADGNGPPPPYPKPPGGGYLLSADDLREIAVLLKKNDPVTID